MGLKIKNFRDTLVSMVDYVSKRTNRLLDFSEGSVLRTIFEAIAMEFEEYYFKMYKNMVYSIENSLYGAFGFDKRPATRAYANVTLIFTDPLQSDLIIKQGTKFSTGYRSGDSMVYETEKDYFVARGSVEATVVAHCTVPGSIGNVLEGSIMNMLNPISVVSSITNREPVLTGRDEESDEERKQRFSHYVETRSKGTVAAIEYGAKEVEGVTGAWVDDETQAGIIRVYAHDESGNLPEHMKKEIEEHLINYRPAGLPLFVLPINKMPVDINLRVTILFEYDSEEFRHHIIQKVGEYLNSFKVAQDLILSDLNEIVRELDRVAIKNCIITSPVQDMEVLPSELIRSGNIELDVIIQ